MEQIPELDRRGLRNFGFTFGGVVAALFGLVLPLLFGRGLPWWPWAAGGAFAVWALVLPETLGGFYRVWMRFGLLLNSIVTPVVLGIVFFLVITPFALVFRLLGKDPMRRRLEPEAVSYRTESAPIPANSLDKPF